MQAGRQAGNRAHTTDCRQPVERPFNGHYLFGCVAQCPVSLVRLHSLCLALLVRYKMSLNCNLVNCFPCCITTAATSGHPPRVLVTLPRPHGHSRWLVWGVGRRGVGGVCTHIKTINFAVIYLNLNVATMHAAAGWQWGVCCLLARSLLAWPFCLNNKAAKSMQQFLYYAQLLALSRHIHMYIMLRILWR